MIRGPCLSEDRIMMCCFHYYLNQKFINRIKKKGKKYGCYRKLYRAIEISETLLKMLYRFISGAETRYLNQ